MELRHLIYFKALAEELSYTKAAEKLHISQPPLSRQITELEHELGVELFHRSTRGVTITPAGRYLEQEAGKILAKVDIVKERVTKIELGKTRLIRIGFVASAMYSFLPEIIGLFRSTFPKLTFELIELATDDQVKALLSGRIDIGFVRSWIIDDGIAFNPVAEDKFVLIYSPSLDIKDQPKRIMEFKSLPYIAHSKKTSPNIAEFTSNICSREGFTPKTIFTVGQVDSIIRLVAAGLGWSIIPDYALSFTKSKVRAIHIPDSPECILLGVAIRSDENDLIITELADIAMSFRKSESEKNNERD
jgi:DNA-binding transcriptional LysR family regulator